jgi:repressor LexA
VERALTPIQAEVLETIQRRLDRGEPVPTYRDLCAEFGWRSTGTARDHLRALERKGRLELSGGRAHRQIRLPEESPAVVRVPLVGRVVAGLPITADENVEARIPVPAEWTGRTAHFALHVDGDSMKDAGILDGDCVVVRRQTTAEDGDIVVATLDGETTLKRLRRRGRRVTLVAENPSYRPIEVRTESSVIQGVVVGLLREYDVGARGRFRRGSRRGRRRTAHDGS